MFAERIGVVAWQAELAYRIMHTRYQNLPERES